MISFYFKRCLINAMEPDGLQNIKYEHLSFKNKVVNRRDEARYSICLPAGSNSPPIQLTITVLCTMIQKLETNDEAEQRSQKQKNIH